MKASVGCSPRLHRFNVCPFGFVGVVRGLHPTNFYFMRILLRKEQGRSTVGRVALIPTSIYITNKFYRSIETLYADVSCLYELFIYAYLRREEDIPTYGFLSLSARFYFMQILINGAMAIAPYPTNTSTLSEKTT